MKISALIKLINPAIEGVSKSNGNPYKRQELVLEWQEQLDNGNCRTQRLMVVLRGQSVDEFAKVGAVAGLTIMEFEVWFDTSSYNNRVYNEVRASFKKRPPRSPFRGMKGSYKNN